MLAPASMPSLTSTPPSRSWLRRAAACMSIGLALWCPHPATAEQLDYARTGPYVQLGLTLGVPSYGWLDSLDDATAASGAAALAVPGNTPVDVGVSSTTLLGFEIGAGWRLTRRFAIDASYEWAGSELWADVVVGPPGAQRRDKQLRGEIETWLALVNGRFYLTTGRIQPFVTGGIGAMKATPIDASGRRDAHGFTSRLGGGLDFYITRRLAATAVVDYAFATGDTGRSNLFGFRASLTWRR